MTADSDGSSLGVQILIIVLLTALNAFFAAAEIAFVSINQGKMAQRAQEGDKKAIKVMRLLENSDEFLATIQVAITFAGFFSSASAATSFSSRIQPLLGNIPGAETFALIYCDGRSIIPHFSFRGVISKTSGVANGRTDCIKYCRNYFVCQKDLKTIRMDFDVLNRVIKTNYTD